VVYFSLYPNTFKLNVVKYYLVIFGRKLMIDSCSNKKVLGLLSDNSTGKTSLAECFLFNSGTIDRLGKIESKSTVSDFSPLETKRGFSINSSMLNYKWKNFQINLVDSPGYADFIGQILSTIKVIDSALLVVDPKSGIQSVTDIIIENLNQNCMPVFCIINKLDQENIDYFKTIDEIKNNFNSNLVPITIPTQTGKNFSNIIDLLQNQSFSYKKDSPHAVKTAIDDKVKEQIQKRHDELIESIVETDDNLLNKYLEGEEIDAKSINDVFKKAVLERKVIPVFAASSAKNIGIDIIMDYINSLLPSPLETEPLKVEDVNEKKEIEIKPSEDGPVLAYVFKNMTDPYIGKLSIFRIFSGKINVNKNYYISSTQKAYKFANIFKLQSKNQTEVQKASCGDIVAVSKIVDISNDDTISSIDKPLKMEKTKYPSPTLPKAIVPVGKGDEEKISNSLSKLVEDDPTITKELNLETHQNIICGMGDLHLSIIKESLKEKFDVAVDLLTPDVAYKETIKKSVKTEYKYKKQSGGRGQYGHVLIELKPLSSGEGFKFENSIFGGSIPKGYIPGVEKGIREALGSGVLAGYPVVDVSVNLYDGSYHSVDSSEMAFKIAASMAFKKGMQDASPYILEPIMELEVTVPEKYMGDIIGDINSKRGKIITITPSNNNEQVIKATVPQSETFNYSVDLRSITQGRGTFKQKFSHYCEIPSNLAEELIEERKKQKE